MRLLFPLLVALISIQTSAQSGRLDSTLYFDFVEEMPLYKNGSKDISTNYKDLDKAIYSQVERTCQINPDSSKILLHFIVEKDGTVNIVRVVKGVCEEMNQSAVAAVKRAKFIPGKQQGKLVRVKMAVVLKYG